MFWMELVLTLGASYAGLLGLLLLVLLRVDRALLDRAPAAEVLGLDVLHGLRRSPTRDDLVTVPAP